MRKIYIFLLALFSVLSAAKLSDLNMPPGFQIEYFARNLEQVRAISVDESGNVYAGSKGGEVWCIAKDGEIVELAEGLRMPVGVDYYKGDLYVSAVEKILVFRNIKQQIKKKKYQYETLPIDLPSDRWHGWKFIQIGPDGKLYVPIGVACNVCEREEPYGAIWAYDLKSFERTLIAEGVRNSVGFDWQRESGKLFFTDNGRDWMGDDLPPCEFNRVDRAGDDFGFPYVHGKNVKDPKYWDDRPKDFEYKQALYEHRAHVAPLGMEFYYGKQFPEDYKGDVFVAEHGSWNRKEKIGYRVLRLKMKGEAVEKAEVFIEGWLQAGDEVWGRPVDLEVMADGSMLLSDDFNNCIYHIKYKS